MSLAFLLVFHTLSDDVPCYTWEAQGEVDATMLLAENFETVEDSNKLPITQRHNPNK